MRNRELLREKLYKVAGCMPMFPFFTYLELKPSVIYLIKSGEICRCGNLKKGASSEKERSEEGKTRGNEHFYAR